MGTTTVTVMEAYNAKVKRVLDNLIDENPEDSKALVLQAAVVRQLKPYFSNQDVFELYATFTEAWLCEIMKSRLSNCGWKDQIKLECSKAIQRRGLDNFNLDEILGIVTPVARSSIPLDVKKDIVALLQETLLKELQEGDVKP